MSGTDVTGEAMITGKRRTSLDEMWQVTFYYSAAYMDLTIVMETRMGGSPSQ
jgi:hypothetical protein